jgi:hypothetical protein
MMINPVYVSWPANCLKLAIYIAPCVALALGLIDITLSNWQDL